MEWKVELSNEVRDWYYGLGIRGKAATARIISRLETYGNELRMPHSRSLGDGLYELRFTCEGKAQRVTYIFEPNKRIITLTTFHKQRNNERAQVLRARRAQANRSRD